PVDDLPADPTIAVFWDDLDFSASDDSRLFWKVVLANSELGIEETHLVLQWDSVAYQKSSTSSSPQYLDQITFQAVLYSGGRMEFHYIDIDSVDRGETYETNGTGGTSATVGIWSGSQDTLELPAAKFVPGPHSIGGSTLLFDPGFSHEFQMGNEDGLDTNDSYVRLAWDTGGAAWDFGVLEYRNDSFGGVDSSEADALREVFIESLGDQILRAYKLGRVFRDDQPLLELSLGDYTFYHDSNGEPDYEMGSFVPDDGTFTADEGANDHTDPVPDPPGTEENFTNCYRTDHIGVPYGTEPDPPFDLADPILDGQEGDPDYGPGVDTTSRSLPGGQPNLDLILRSARTSEGHAENLSLTIDKINLDDGTGTGNRMAMENGRYIVELLFAETDEWFSTNPHGVRTFDVILEGETVLGDYSISGDILPENDYTDVVFITTYGDEIKVRYAGGKSYRRPRPYTSTGYNTDLYVAGSGKRFEIDVTGNDGLQIELRGLYFPPQGADADTTPALNAIRIVRADPPRAENIVIRGSSWADGVEYSYETAMHVTDEGEIVIGVPNQLRPIPVENADTIDIYFDSPVHLDYSDLSLDQTLPLPGGGASTEYLPKIEANFSYDQQRYVATWKFNDGSALLEGGKYAIHLDTGEDGVYGAARVQLDGDWHNADNGTPDNFDDDILDPERYLSLLSGNGTEGSTNQEFRFHFSILPGDSDQDGIVEAGITNPEDDDVQTNILADVDGNGVVEENDIVRAEYYESHGRVLPLKTLNNADYIDDEIVDVEDFNIWYYNFGTVYGASGVTGDADGDGDVDGNDFLFWQRSFGNESAWYIKSAKGSGAAGSGYSIIGPDVPRIVNVIISGSFSQHDPYSFGDALYNGQPVIGSGFQLVTVPVGGADTITIVFSEAVNITADCLDIVGLTTANEPTLAEFAYDVTTHTASWRFEGWALGDRYLLMVSDAVTDVDGNLLDGEWVNPASMTTVNALVSEFPSGDGDPGGNFHFLFTLLPGDANLDLKVDGSDLAIMAGNWGLGIGDLSALFSQGDFSGDGMVSSADFALLLINFNRNLQNTWLLADFDGDFDVDDDDLAVISANAGMTGATWEDGDLNGDGEVTVEDLDLALALFGLDLDLVS
ncbi:MAG: hypothetical protein JW829_11665, partial [Pirellulales bacterium]|nr:hypothetical protein [Pirellulales bacterium]